MRLTGGTGTLLDAQQPVERDVGRRIGTSTRRRKRAQEPALLAGRFLRAEFCGRTLGLAQNPRAGLPAWLTVTAQKPARDAAEYPAAGANRGGARATLTMPLCHNTREADEYAPS